MAEKRITYIVYTLVFSMIAAIVALFIPNSVIDKGLYGSLIVIFMLGVGLCLIALSYMQKYHIRIKYKKIYFKDEDGLITFFGKTRFLNQTDTIWTIDMNRIKSLNLDFILFEPESYSLVFWDENPELELTYFGLEQNNLEAEKVYVYPIAALKENPLLGVAFKAAFSPYIQSGKLLNELDLDTWRRHDNARSEGVELSDTGVIFYKNTTTP